MTTEHLSRQTYDEERMDSGCVIRALESALGANATPGEWELRLGFIRKIKPAQSALQALLEYDDNQVKNALNIRTILNHLTVSATPLGVAMRRFNISHAELDEDEIKSMLEGGNKIVMSFYFTEDEVRGKHMADLELDKSGKIRSRSDEGNPTISFPNGAKGSVIIFSPKAK